MIKLPKGTRDFPPEEKILRNEIVSTLTSVFERYGYSPFETPSFELFDVLSSKYAGGEEILKETFKFSDQGKRELALRYDLTVPLARFIAMNPRMKMPFKRYHVGEVYRDGPVASARYRQFTQCDVDVVGARSQVTDAELISVAQDVFSELKLDFTIKVNNRKLLTELVLFCGGEKEKADSYILSIDKLEKFGKETVSKELEQKGLNQESIKKLFLALTSKGSNSQKIKELKKLLKVSNGLEELQEVLSLVDSPHVIFDPSLARGLTYYTGTILEVTLKNSNVTSSVCGGGRYDNLIGNLVGKGEVPAVGISFGLDRIFDALEGREKKKTTTKVFIAPINTYKECVDIAKQLRKANINTEIDVMDRNPGKNIQYANAMNIPFVLFVGEEEVKQKKVKVKNMESGKEELMSVNEFKTRVTDEE